MSQISDLLTTWRDIGPAAWAESEFGWIGTDGRPITLLAWQRSVLDAWWAHSHDVSTLAISNVKKTGKTLLDGILLAWRWLALPGLHLAAANSLDQATGRQFQEISDMVTRHPYLSQVCIITNTKLVFQPTNSTLQALSSDYAGAGGANFITVSHTEAWAIQHENDVRLWEELTPVPGSFHGFPCLRIADSYAGYVSESETWHTCVDRGVQGKRVDDDWPVFKAGQLLIFHMDGKQAQESCFRGNAEERENYYAEQRRTLRSNSYLRLHENIRVANIGNFCQQDDWEALIDKKHKPLKAHSDQAVYIGLDLATAPQGDNCALIGTYFEDGKVKIAFHKVWLGRERFRKLSLTKDVYPYIVNLAQKYKVVGLYYDPWQAQALTEMLHDVGISCIEISQSRTSRGPRDTRLLEMVSNGELVLYDHEDLRYAPGGANAKELPNGLIFLAKAGGRSKIDLLVALSNCASECHDQSNQWSWVKDPFADPADPELTGGSIETPPGRPGSDYLHPQMRVIAKSKEEWDAWVSSLRPSYRTEEEKLGKDLVEHVRDVIKRERNRDNV